MDALASIFAAMGVEKLVARMAKTDEKSLATEDLYPGLPGYAEFVEASDAEYGTLDFEKAKKMYERSCDKEHPMGLCNYALWYLEGGRPGVRKDLSKAFNLFERASKIGLGMALYNVADFYLNGKGGISKDPKKAYQLAKESIRDYRIKKMKQWQPFAMLGKMCVTGEGCRKNVQKASKYFHTSEELGHDANAAEMKKMVDLLAQMDPMSSQRESDRRWDRMCAWLKEHPEEKQETMGDHLRILNKFGFDLRSPLTLSQKQMKGGFDKFMEFVGEKGGMLTMDSYEMENAPLAPKLCGFCGKAGATKRCSKCDEGYCNRNCQKSDWKDHKRVCEAVQDALY